MKKKYLFISNMASPYQVKFCYSLQEYFDAEFWFYEHIDETRPDWWKIPLGDKCKIMKASGKFPNTLRVGYYYMLFLVLFIPEIIYSLSDKRIKAFAYIAVILALLFLYIRNLNPSSPFVPYEFFWQ